MIPRIIHQIWLGEDSPAPPRHMQAASETWTSVHPEWEHRVWGRSEVEALFASSRPDLLPLFRGYRHWVERADAARYLVLHEYGGAYVDFDIAAVAPLDVLTGESLVLAPTRPAGISNDFIMCSPGHPFLGATLDSLPAAAARWSKPWMLPYMRVMLGTGPLFLTGLWRRVGGEHAIRLLTPGEYGHGAQDDALVRHLRGNTWHGWDGHIIAWVWERAIARSLVK